ncbi:hypothetical protein [Pseudarthrobacter sp. MEB009]|uniref:hypothetical protein n=1 Tax=Pseudarthrobacter sp. MEB009 TaxID=3040326 RepID=UPI002555B7CF|nr:hypothetical protein [Pseudarthrobacter sp. MEB009]
MPEPAEVVVAVRATAVIEPSRWLRRPVRLIRYDAIRTSGQLDFDERLPQVMYRGQPADFATVSDAVHAHCPEVGPGLWIDQAGRVVDGPTRTNPDPPKSRGVPRKYGVSTRVADARAISAWRLGGGAAGLSLGLVLIAGPMGKGFGGFLGALCVLIGLAAFAGLARSKRK